jgi:hypothetical protein
MQYNDTQHELANVLLGMNIGQWADIGGMMVQRQTSEIYIANERRLGFMEAFDALKELFD